MIGCSIVNSAKLSITEICNFPLDLILGSFFNFDFLLVLSRYWFSHYHCGFPCHHTMLNFFLVTILQVHCISNQEKQHIQFCAESIILPHAVYLTAAPQAIFLQHFVSTTI